MSLSVFVLHFLQVLQYFEQLKNSVDGWKMCAQAFSTGAYQGSVKNTIITVQTKDKCTNYNQISPDKRSLLLLVLIPPFTRTK